MKISPCGFRARRIGIIGLTASGAPPSSLFGRMASAGRGMSQTLHRMWLLLLSIGVFALGGWMLGQQQIKVATEDLVSSQELSMGLTAAQVSGFLSEPIWQLRSFASERQIQEDVADGGDFSHLRQALLRLAARNPSYQQVRWIDETGMERVRVQRINSHHVFIPDEFLQDKSDRYYFQAGARLGPGELYFSPIDLNVENGEIESPLRPTIRIVTRVFNVFGNPRGLLIINRDVHEILGIIQSVVVNRRVMLVNQQGQWLLAPQPDLDWGFMYGKPDGVATDYPALWTDMQAASEGHAHTDQGIWIWSTFTPERVISVASSSTRLIFDRYKLMTLISSEDLLAIRYQVLLQLAPYCFVAALLLWLLLIRLSDSRERERDAIARLEESERLRKVEVRAEQAELMAHAIVESNIHGMLTINSDGVIVMTNPSLEKLFGYAPAELVGEPLERLVPEAQRLSHEKMRNAFIAKPAERQMRNGLPVVGLHKDGTEIPVEVSLSPIKVGSVMKVTATVFDIRARLANEKILKQMASVFENTGDGIVITDADSLIINANAAFEEITGYTLEEVRGKSTDLYQSGRHSKEFYADMNRTVLETGHWSGEHMGRRKDGKIYTEWLTVSKVTNGDGAVSNYVYVFSDISRLKDSQRQLDRLTYLDTLTELPNRRMFMMRLEHAIEQSRRRNQSLAVIVLDLDNFKHINDGLGHKIGDQLLQSVARVLADVLRSEDTIARLGGDEFALLLEYISSPDSATVLAAKLIKQLDQPLMLDDHQIRITSSIGICFFPQDGEDTETLMRNADAAMYRAKEEGRNCYHFYTEALTTRSVERLHLERSIRQSLDNQDFYLVYQPQVDLATGHLVGVEALIRWDHPEMGLVSPARFIPVAEESGLIYPIERWVFHEACTQARKWLDEGVHFGRMAINLSGRSLNAGGVPKIVSQILLDTRCPAHCIELEVSEGFIMQRAVSAIRQLNELREMGIAISIDDFGTGYSSLSYLKQLPIDKLKIDQAFVRDIGVDDNDRAIVSAVIAMGKKLRLRVIAEGVETEEQADYLIAEDCEEAQGYFYSKPVSPEEIVLLQRTLGQTHNGDKGKIIVFPMKKKF